MVILAISTNIYAQRTPPSQLIEKYWSVGFQVNAFNYFGDLNPLKQYVSTKFEYTRPNFAINISKKMTKNLSLRASLGYGRITADDSQSGSLKTLETAGRYGRNLHFRNDLFELAVVGIYEFKSSKGRFYRRSYLTPYIMGGIAGFYHNPKAKAPGGGDWVALQPLGTEGQGKAGYAKAYSLWQLAFPVGVGLRYRLNDKLDISAEIGFRFTTTDHLDDVGGRYANINDLSSDLAKKMADRSAEPTSALTGQTRDLAAISAIVGGVSNMYGSNDDLGNLVPVAGYQRLGSYGLRGDVRGTGAFGRNDMYVVTGFHLNYILTTRRHPRYRSR
ncbi:MAG: hypothetical protein EAZ85_09135 [Bacteroidetes bacterium]|nr:MAG: hypothetical protein EAZ85_09135 [Bacteroidota bacterium]TAG88809.1 MAG: hypothetical protein EAZ20_07835 [Bacteroidota bacterium]